MTTRNTTPDVHASTTLSLKGKTALVTGSASGIGKRIAEVFADAGANLVIADLKLADAQATADEIAKKGVKTLAVQMHVTDEAAVDAGFAQVQ
ncbi:MAG: SDR family NAD(P)-dependent oxidoreductase, partial [Ottowia sp.]|nr:SDR family NAD(P)-dependent oxidoreductase [Ottowia sp.]